MSEQLTENEAEVLEALFDLRDHEHGVSPLMFGGHDGSHHSSTATKLVRRGLADRGQRPSISGIRNSYGYWITDSGTSLVAARRREFFNTHPAPPETV